MNEWDLIEKIKMRIARDTAAPGHLSAGIGDDCAIFNICDGRWGLITTDIGIEGVHFTVSGSEPVDIGYKMMIANISDIAATGGTPFFAFISLGIPDRIDEPYILSLYDGFIEAGKGLPLHIAGGDISRSAELVINIALYGESSSPVFRSGAKPGDSIFVTGTLGDSQAGLELFQSGVKEKHQALLRRHFHPDRRIDHLPFILDKFAPSSMIDISDGFLSDLRHVCVASGTGFLITSESIPLSDHLMDYCRNDRKAALDLALKSGEEYELLFTTSASIDADMVYSGTVPLTRVGAITPGGFRINYNGKDDDISIQGYEHFSHRGKP